MPKTSCKKLRTGLKIIILIRIAMWTYFIVSMENVINYVNANIRDNLKDKI